MLGVEKRSKWYGGEDRQDDKDGKRRFEGGESGRNRWQEGMG